MVRRVQELDLTGKTVFLRVDFNVPIEQGRITEPHRIESALPTVRYLLGRARKEDQTGRSCQNIVWGRYVTTSNDL